jgi:peptidoglycan/LPS O-acetylase OafA/YrhL
MLNLTGLFGFFSWDTYLSGGVWSIGNELVFYVFFPFFVFFSKRNIAFMVVLSVALFGLYLYFSFGVLPSCPEPEQWRNYINPLNQVFLFLGGFLVGFFLKNQRYKNGVLVIVLLASVFLFVFYPVFGPQFAVKTGFNRLVFTSLCLVICFCFYKISMPLPRLVGRGFSFLGEISYSVYLLHPHVYDLMGRFRFQVYPISGYARTGISIVLTLVVSYFVYRYFERVFMRLGSTSTQQER